LFHATSRLVSLLLIKRYAPEGRGLMAAEKSTRNDLFGIGERTVGLMGRQGYGRCESGIMRNMTERFCIYTWAGRWKNWDSK